MLRPAARGRRPAWDWRRARERGAATTAPTTATAGPAAADGLVLRVEYTGGFVSPSATAARLPLVSVYADGRVIAEGPVPAIYPGPALPNLQEQRDRPGRGAGPRRPGDGGRGRGHRRPRHAPDRRRHVDPLHPRHGVASTYVREVYALSETPSEDSGLTEEQQAARTKLSDLLAALSDTAGGSDSAPYVPEPSPRSPPPGSTRRTVSSQPEIAWPGPALPGEPIGGLPDVGCVTATGDQAQALLDGGRRRRTPRRRGSPRTAPAGRSPSARCCPTSPAAPTWPTERRRPGPREGGPGPSLTAFRR